MIHPALFQSEKVPKDIQCSIGLILYVNEDWIRLVSILTVRSHWSVWDNLDCRPPPQTLE